jgi:tetratricopeptide (TPR) repeat protein
MNKISLLILLLVFKVGAQTPTLNVSDSLYAVGNYSEAIQDLENIEEKSEAVYSRLAKSYVAKGDFYSALKNYRTVLDKNPNKVLTTMEYGEVLIKARKLKSADSLYINLSTSYPKNASFQFQLGTIKEKQNDSTAIEYWQNTIALDKTHQQALYKLAKYELSRRNFPLAEKLSLQGLEANSSNA